MISSGPQGPTQRSSESQAPSFDFSAYSTNLERKLGSTDLKSTPNTPLPEPGSKTQLDIEEVLGAPIVVFDSASKHASGLDSPL